MLTLLATLVLSAAPPEASQMDAPEASRMEAPGWARRFLRPSAVEVLERATQVEAFRLVSHDADEEWRSGRKTAERFNGYVVTARSGPLPIAFLGRAAAVFLSDDTYAQPQTNVGSLKLCGGLHPGVGLRFTRGRQRPARLLSVQRRCCRPWAV